jgi:eukaryotic-like serine/threonine-protein kinase
MAFVPKTVGRYTIYGEIAAGGMATVHLGRMQGHGNFARTVAIKRLHPQFAADPEFVAMFLDEAWLAAKIHHPNVVQTLDVVSEGTELFLVMDFVQGESLSRIWRAVREGEKPAPVAVTASIICGVLHGLHAAHEARDESGAPLNIVHRDVSPQNVMVGMDGVARLVDFGVAKATVRLQSTHDGQVKGKIAYMAPEQLELHEVSRLSDVYAASVLLWEGLVGRRLFDAMTEGQLVSKVVQGAIQPPSVALPGLTSALDDVVMRGLAADPTKRFATAREMALAIERSVEIARASQVGEWVEEVAAPLLAKRTELIAELLGTPSARSIPVREPAERAAGDGTGSGKSAGTGTGTGVRTLVEGGTPSGIPSRPSFPAEPSTGSRTGSSASRPAARRRVLIIDDSEIILGKVKRALEEDGFEVIATTQPVGNARHLVGTDLVIIDYHMPGLDGGTVISSLRSAAQSSGHPTLFYLYTQDPGVAKDYARLGFDGSFSEKGDDKALVRQVRSAFRVVQMRAMRRS